MDSLGFPVVGVGSVDLLGVLVVGAGSVDSLGFSVVGDGSVGGSDSTCTYKKNNLYLNR